MKKYLLNLCVILWVTSATAFAQTITGRVTAASDNSPLPGVSVLLKGTATGTTTDAQGRYTLNIDNNAGSGVLSFSFIGFATQEIAVDNRSVIDVSLAEDIAELNEVVVTAMGIQREQKALGYAVSTVTADQLTATGNTNFASALYGKAAGVRITTAPGGATSAVNVQIRGVNSLNFTNGPLYVVDGVMIRNNTRSPSSADPTKNANTGFNNDGYWDDQKIQGNGLLDINPADIESLTVLKGASASALYGSEAANGVVVITTKRGVAGQGLGVDVNYTYNVEEVAFLPKYQSVYGPGYDRARNLSNGATEDGWLPADTNGDGVSDDYRPWFSAWAQFGPKFNGEVVPWWDGQMRPYTAKPNNYKDFYRTGYNSIFNAAISNSTDKATYRFSFTRNDYEGTQVGGKMERNTFNLNSTIKLHERLKTDIVISYINSNVHNRPEQINRIAANYGGFLNRADDVSLFFENYQTSKGYKYVRPVNAQYDPAEALKYNTNYDLMDLLWKQLRNSEDELQDRLISSVTLNYDIVKNLSFRGRVGGDFTSLNIEKKEHTQYPMTFYTSPTNDLGFYRVSNGRYSIFYTDALLTYTKELTPDLTLSVNGGMQSRDEKYRDQRIETTGGLVNENWFAISNSRLTPDARSTRKNLFKYAVLGIVNLNYKDYLFLEGTARQEYSSSFPPGDNSYFYPSVNAGFVFTDAFGIDNPILTYGKIRGSYGVVGNAPQPYAANITYTQQSLQTTNGSVPSLTAQGTNYGNEDIKPENKYETELGLESRLFNNKIGLDITYYNSRIVDQILAYSLPASVGTSSRLANIGELHSNGLEVAIDATPVTMGSFSWNTRFNFSLSQTKVTKLMEGVDEIIFFNSDGGAARIVAEVDQRIGNIYAHPRATDANGNFIINEDGLYVLSEDYVKVGNIMPKVLGGFSNTLTYKGFALDFIIDYRFGGQLLSPPHSYNLSAGMYESTLEYRDEANGGLPYNIDASGNKVLAANHASAQYHDGILLDGVNSTGEKNTTIIDAASYYINTFYWSTGWYEKGAVLDNSYIKMREASLSYNLPANLVSKLKLQNIRVSLVGRNLFYIWKTLENLDPEVAIGTNWFRQGVDEGSSAASRSYGFSINASF